MTNNDDISKKFNEASETDETGTYSETDTKNLEDIYNNSLILRANNDLALYIQNQIKVYNEPISEQLKNLCSDIKELRAENKVISKDIKNIKENANKDNLTNRWILGIIMALVSLFLPIFIAFQNNAINKRIESIQQNNSMQIQRDVAQEFLNYKR